MSIWDKKYVKVSFIVCLIIYALAIAFFVILNIKEYKRVDRAQKAMMEKYAIDFKTSDSLRSLNIKIDSIELNNQQKILKKLDSLKNLLK